MLTNLLLRDLIRLFDYSNAEISSGDGEHTQGIPAWTLKRFGLTQSQLDYWFTRVGYADHCFTWFYDEKVDVEVEVDDDTGGYFYRSPENYKIHTISEDDIAIYAPNTDLILHTVADLLDIPMAFRSRINNPAVHDVLWNLGKMRIGRIDIDVWIAKEFSSNKRAVYHYLERPELPELAILLTCGGPVSEFTRRPKRFQIVSLLEILPPSSGAVTFDKQSIENMVSHTESSALTHLFPVNFNEYTNALTIASKTEPWIIGGPRQAAAIKYMVEQAHKGRWELPASEILGAAYGDQSMGRIRRMQDLFKSNTCWRSYINNPRKGIWGFLT